MILTALTVSGMCRLLDEVLRDKSHGDIRTMMMSRGH